MRFFRGNRRRSRRSRDRSLLILWTIAAIFVYSAVAPFLDSSPGELRPTAERRERATTARATARPIVRATARIAAPTQAPPADDACYSLDSVYVQGAINVRSGPGTSFTWVDELMHVTLPVLDSIRKPDYCWLKIGTNRWIARLDHILEQMPAAQPQAKPAAPAARDSAVQQAMDALQRLVVARENRCSPYHSDDYPYPQSVEPQIIGRMGGRIYGPYTGTTFAHRGETDIEHIVAKSEAHDSGLCAAGAQTRKAFARDLLNLTLASPTVNRHQKSGKDFAEWLPARNKCWYAATIIEVKSKYRLSVDGREKAALQQTLQSCSSLAMR